MPLGTRVVLYWKGPFPLMTTPSGIPRPFPPSSVALRAYIFKMNAIGIEKIITRHSISHIHKKETFNISQ